MANENVKSVINAAEIVRYWSDNVAPKYFNMDNVNTYRAGTLGYINDIVATAEEDTLHAVMVARREFYPNTAQYMKSLYRHAAARSMNAPMATPATANVLLMIQQSDILRYGVQDGDLHTFVLDDTFVAMVDDIPFMLDYPITILSVAKSNGKYAHTTHYDFYIKNTLSSSLEKYLPNKTLNYKGTEYVIIAARMRQIDMYTETVPVVTNAVINTVTQDFNYDGDLANFEVFYQETDNSPEIQLEKRMKDSGISKNPFCWYELVDEDTIRLTFPMNAYFVPRLNSKLRIKIATTLGKNGEFDTYDSDIVSYNDSTKYPYNQQVPVFGTVDGASTGAKEIITKEDFRSEVMRAYCTNHTYISVNDLQQYFNTLMIGTSDRFKFVPKRDDAFVRLYGAFLLMKDADKNVIPTNTLDVDLDPLKPGTETSNGQISTVADFDIYSDVVHRYIIKPGACFTYQHVSDDVDDNERYILRRIPGVNLSTDTANYDNGGHCYCSECGRPWSEEFTLDEADDDYVCPSCGADKSKFVTDKFIFTNPYLISVSTDTFLSGYFLNSTVAHHNIVYSDVNDTSIVQFIARHLKVERNAIAGENFYRISMAVSPSIEDIDQDTIFEDRSEDVIVAKHNGYVKAIEFRDNAVYADIVYTDDPTLEGDIPDDELQETIQVSSYIEKVNETFYVCPVCGHCYTAEEYNQAKEAGFVDENGDPLLCQFCDDGNTTPIQDAVETYVDFDYLPGYKMQFSVGNELTKNDVIAIGRPKDLGRIRLMLDLNNVMNSTAKRYIPMTLEEAHDEDTQYYVFAAYISTNDLIDSNDIMEITNGYVLTDGANGSTRPLSIPIEGLALKIHAFYQYRDDDELDEATRNPSHQYSSFAYAQGYTFTNTYTLEENDSITLIKSLDNAKGFLDALERPVDPTPEPEPEPDPIPTDHPADEWEIRPIDPATNYLRTIDHERLSVVSHDDRYDRMPIAVDNVVDNTVHPVEEEQTYYDEHKLDEDPVYDEKIYLTSTTVFGENFMYRLRNCPFVSANWIKQKGNVEYFIEKIIEHYAEIDKIIIDLENAFTIDMKLYNSYGKSKFFKVGNSSHLELLDAVNITMNFGFGLNFPASADVFRSNFRAWLQSYVEATDDMVGNGIDLYIMNLVSAAKVNFGEIGYMEYYGLNEYDYSAQRITAMSDEEILKVVKADSFVPEFLNIVRETVSGVNRPKVGMTIEIIES